MWPASHAHHRNRLGREVGIQRLGAAFAAITGVLDAAELGFAIDGKMCHAVPYKVWDTRGATPVLLRTEAQCQPDYKGLIATAKRLKVVQDVWARPVYAGDEFEMYEENGVTHYAEHCPDDVGRYFDRLPDLMEQLG